MVVDTVELELLEAVFEKGEVLARSDGPDSISMPPANKSPEASAEIASPFTVTAGALGRKGVPPRAMAVRFMTNRSILSDGLVDLSGAACKARTACKTRRIS